MYEPVSVEDLPKINNPAFRQVEAKRCLHGGRLASFAQIVCHQSVDLSLLVSRLLCQGLTPTLKSI